MGYEKINPILESLNKINEVSIHDFKGETFKNVVDRRISFKDFIYGKDRKDVFNQIVDYVKSVKSLKEVEMLLDFARYNGRGKDVTDFYNSFDDSDRDELYKYANQLCDTFNSKYKKDFVDIVKDLKDLDSSKPEVFKNLVKSCDHFVRNVFKDFYLTIDTEDYAAMSNVNHNYYVTVWVGNGEDSWEGYMDTGGICQEIAGPWKCRNMLYTVLLKLYLYYDFLENWNRVKGSVEKFIKDSFK